MSFAVDKRTELRERKALVKAWFSLGDALSMCPILSESFFGENSRGAAGQSPNGESKDDYCPFCRESGMAVRAEVFRCSECNAAGDAVTWVMIARSVSMSVALDLIEKSPQYLNNRRNRS